MLTLNNIISTRTDLSEEDGDPKVVTTPTISWKYFKKSRSHSPKDDYNFRLHKIPDSKIELLQKLTLKNSKPFSYKNRKTQNTRLNISKPTIADIKKSKETSPASPITKKIVEKKNSCSIKEIDENCITQIGEMATNLINQTELVEEHPLYSPCLPKIMNNSFRNDTSTTNIQRSKSPLTLTLKQITKENQIKLFQLDKMLIDQNSLLPSHKTALICTKILEILEETPDLFHELSQNFSIFLKKFLFCEEDKIYNLFSNLKAFNKVKKPQTYLRLLEILFEEIQNINVHNLNNFDFKKQQVIEVTEKNRLLEEELFQLKNKFLVSNEQILLRKETGEKELKDQVKNKKIIYFDRNWLIFKSWKM